MKLKNFSFSNQNWNKKNKNPEKSGKIRKKSENPKKSFQKIYHFLIDFHSLTHSGGSSVPLGTIINSSQ